MMVGLKYKNPMKQNPLRTVCAWTLFSACVLAQNPNLEKPPAPQAVRNPLLYTFDTTSLQDRLAEKLEKAPNRDVLRWAITQLGEMGDEAIPALRRAFYRNFSRAEFFPTLSNICEALGQTRSKLAVPILLDAVTHPSGVVRTRAVDSLVHIQDPDSFPVMRAMFPLESKEYKTKLLNAMASLGSKEFVTFTEELFETALRSLQDLCLQYVADRYVQDGKALLRKIFEHPPGNVHLKLIAAMGLVQLGEPEAKIYLAKVAAEASSIDDRVKALLGLASAHHVEELAKFVDNSDPSLRQGLVTALGVCLSHQTPLADTPESRARTIEILKTLAKDFTPSVRSAAIKTLALHGERSAMDPYLDILRQETDPERLKEALELVRDPQIRETRAAPILAARLKGAGIESQKLFLQGLGALHDAQGVAPLLECLQNPPKNADLGYREYVALQVGFLGTPAVEPLIRLAKETKDGDVRFWAIQALAWTQDKRASAYLFERIGDTQEHPQLRAILIPQIPRFAGIEGAAPTKRMLLREPDPKLRSMLNDLLWDYY